jgi:hypothetical protein
MSIKTTMTPIVVASMLATFSIPQSAEAGWMTKVLKWTTNVVTVFFAERAMSKALDAPPSSKHTNTAPEGPPPLTEAEKIAPKRNSRLGISLSECKLTRIKRRARKHSDGTILGLAHRAAAYATTNYCRNRRKTAWCNNQVAHWAYMQVHEESTKIDGVRIVATRLTGRNWISYPPLCD